MPTPAQRPDRLDLDIVAHQLGRASVDDVHPVSRVATRCPWQLPAVVECLPYDAGGTPFPTLFYLTCPTAVAAVGSVEGTGWSRELGETVGASGELRRSVLAAQAYECRRRARLATGPAAAGAARARDGGTVLRSGIGGTRRVATRVRSAAPAEGLKCLHAHAAHGLARPQYRFGALVLDRARAAAGSLWCDDARCTRLAASGPGAGGAGGAGHSPSVGRDLPETPPASTAGSLPIPVAVVDLGTNTCRLLLGRVGARWCGPIENEARVTTVVRLGQGVDETGRLAGDAVARTRACLADYVRRIERFAPAGRRLTATSALRDAADGARFLDEVERDFGLPWCILSGEEEAAAAFRGAVCGAAGTAARAGALSANGCEPLILVVDIGGGSTELVIGRAADVQAGEGPSSAPTLARSVNVGAVRLTERYFRQDPPTGPEWAAAVRRTRAELRAAVPEAARTGIVVAIGVAGTITTLVANKLGLREYRSELVDGQPLHLWEIERAIRAFRAMTSAERARLPGIQLGREDVILAGALIAREACLLFGLPGLWCGESDILEGVALELADSLRH